MLFINISYYIILWYIIIFHTRNNTVIFNAHAMLNVAIYEIFMKTRTIPSSDDVVHERLRAVKFLPLQDNFV